MTRGRGVIEPELNRNSGKLKLDLKFEAWYLAWGQSDINFYAWDLTEPLELDLASSYLSSFYVMRVKI